MRGPAPSASDTPLLLGAPIVGNTVYNRLTSPTKMRRHLESIYVDDRMVTPQLVQHYVPSARSRRQARHRRAAERKLNVDVRAAAASRPAPTLLLGGDLARQNSVEPLPTRSASSSTISSGARSRCRRPAARRAAERSMPRCAPSSSGLDAGRARWHRAGDGLTLPRPDRDTDSHRLAAFVIFRPLCRIRR
jgi:hypothetical protein